jgi:hypothetical protein
MNQKDELLKNAVEALKQKQIPAGPPEDLAKVTLQKLEQIPMQQQEHFDKQVVLSKRFMIINNLVRIAAAVIVSISIGYAAGRISAPKSPDMEQIRTKLEPAIREKLIEDVQLGLASNYIQMKEELTAQYQQDLRQSALEILSASGNITNQLLEELVQAIATAQLQDRQWVAAALEQTERNRLADKNQLGGALVNFASKTVQDLQQTQQNVAVIAKFLTNTNTDKVIPNENEKSNN